MTKDEVRAVLEPHHDLIRAVIDDAWDEWRQMEACRRESRLPPMLYKRSISNYVFDAIARRAIPAFAAEAQVNVRLEAQTFKLQFRGICARFKKGGADGLGCNVPTQAAMAFMEAEGVLPGMPPETTKIEIIWQPNDIWTRVERVLVVARDGDNLIWDYEIERRGGAKIFVVPTIVPPSDPDGRDLVKPKATPVEKPDEV